MSGPTIVSFSGAVLGGYELNNLAINGITGIAHLTIESQVDEEAYELTITARLRPKEKLRGAERPPYPGREKWRSIVPIGTRVK